ncbi:deoxycytidylate deaminase [Xylophilus rhododendri]|uniref:Deoxycytidylate deaminase n=1 Tax=Xylophilus rhododendri TaxID=2697032 RepID=A0A857J8S1_9BURK|nr:anti-phage dCTP deaminase [Xylophilus rhododendri]QHI99623.1 deoxycytidylate deaminase [Xylophilus rhododendri]
MSVPAHVISIKPEDVRKPARLLFNELEANELIFAVVGPVGSGTTFVADALENLVRKELNATNIARIKASNIIAEFIGAEELARLEPNNRLTRARKFQDAGDELRKQDEAELAVRISSSIKAARHGFHGGKEAATPVIDEKKAAPTIYIVDSLKHPTEVELLRGLYREAFCLIGVVCEERTRLQRLQDEKCKDSTKSQILEFMARDEDEDLSWGQKVAETFHLADFFVDNTPPRVTQDQVPNPDWVVNDKLGRLVDILSGKKIVRPEPSETGMFHAKGAQLRSSCLSRQVGAALTDGRGNVIATGTNEVPMAGGGVYGSGFDKMDGDQFEPDHRCHQTNQYCSNSRTQTKIVEEVIKAIPQLAAVVDKADLIKALKKTALGRLLEFSRAVHAEMDALLTAARQGACTVGAKLFVTTFPCHYCARHIVTAGVEEVQYIEPYPKSRAFELHSDAIQQIASGWKSPSKNRNGKVLFRLFTGVAPRLYRRAFMKDRKLKNGVGDMEIGRPMWTTGLLRESYTSVENKLEGSP